MARERVQEVHVVEPGAAIAPLIPEGLISPSRSVPDTPPGDAVAKATPARISARPPIAVAVIRSSRNTAP